MPLLENANAYNISIIVAIAVTIDTVFIRVARAAISSVVGASALLIVGVALRGHICHPLFISVGRLVNVPFARVSVVFLFVASVISFCTAAHGRPRRALICGIVIASVVVSCSSTLITV